VYYSIHLFDCSDGPVFPGLPLKVVVAVQRVLAVKRKMLLVKKVFVVF